MGCPREWQRVSVKKFVPSLETSSSPGRRQEFARTSLTIGGVRKVLAKGVLC